MEKKLEVHLSGLQNLSRGDSEVLKIKVPQLFETIKKSGPR